MSRKIVRNLLIVVVVVVVVAVALSIPYFANYSKPLSGFEEMLKDYNIRVAGNTKFVSRGAIKKMVELSDSMNSEHYDKYKKVLTVPLPLYPMSAKQQVELGILAMEEGDASNFFMAHRDQIITVYEDLTFSFED